MACLEPVIEDRYIAETTANPEIYRKCKRRNRLVQSVELKEANEKIDQEQKIELKRITQERAALSRELRKMIIDGAVLQRSDVITDFPALRHRRKSIEFEDVTLPSKISASSNLTAFVNFGRYKSPVVSNRVIKRAMSDQKLNTLTDLKIYQHWEGDPAAINSVRREQKSRAVQIEHTIFARSRRYDQWNEPIKSTLPAVLSRQNSSNSLIRASSAELRPLSADGTPSGTGSQTPIRDIKPILRGPSMLARSDSAPIRTTGKPRALKSVRPENRSQTESNGGQHDNAQSEAKSQAVTKEAKHKSPFIKGSKRVSPADPTAGETATTSITVDKDKSLEKRHSKTAKQPKRKSSFGKNKIQPQ